MKTHSDRFRRTPFLRAGIVAATAILASWACIIPESTPTVPGATPVVPDGWVCYQNLTYGFEVCYPEGAYLNTASAEHSRILLNFLSGTNLVDKWMDVDSREGVAECASPNAEGYSADFLDEATQTINGLEFLVQSAHEGAAGNQYDWTGYSTERDGVCVSLTGVLHSMNPVMYPTPPPEFDLAGENALFAQIVDTFRWLDTATPAVTPIPADWLCYQNGLYAFEVCYPPDAALSGETPEHVRINLTFAPDTNLHEKWMDVDGRTVPPDCESPQASGYDPASIAAETRTIAGLEFLVQSAGEGAAGNLYHWIGYSTERDGVCASLTGVLHSVQPENYSTPPPVYDDAAESAVFDQIAATFRWLSAATPTAPADDTPTATFTANANCRRGASLDHQIITYLNRGQVVEIVGRNADASWWLIQLPGSPIQCWVGSKFAETGGDLSRVPFVESPVLGCWYQANPKLPAKCVAPCPDGATPGGVCEP